jgi:hypothetical protein
MAEKVGFDDFYRQNTAVEKFHPHYFVGESLDFGLFQQSPRGRTRKIFFLNSITVGATCGAGIFQLGQPFLNPN